MLRSCEWKQPPTCIGSTVSNMHLSVLITSPRSLTLQAAQPTSPHPQPTYSPQHYVLNNIRVIWTAHLPVTSPLFNLWPQPPWVISSSVFPHFACSKLYENMNANLFIPRRNSNSLCPSGTLKTLITVPCRGKTLSYRGWWMLKQKEEFFFKKRKQVLTFSEALANFVPEALKVRAARGLSWAWISVRVL